MSQWLKTLQLLVMDLAFRFGKSTWLVQVGFHDSVWFVGHIRSQGFTSESHQYELGFVFLLAVFLFCSMYRSESRTSLLKYLFYFELKRKIAVVRVFWGESGCSYQFSESGYFFSLPLANCWTLRFSWSLTSVPSFLQPMVAKDTMIR